MSSDGTITVEAKVDSSSFSKELNNLKNLADTALKSVTTTGEDVQKKWGTATKTLAEDLNKLVTSFQSLGRVNTSGAANGLSILESAIYAASTATQVATLAQLAYNTALTANPIGIAAAAVATLTAGIVYLTSSRKNEISAVQEEIRVAKEKIALIREESQAKEEAEAAREKQVELDLAQIGRTEYLTKQLFGLVEANGKVKTGYEEQAKTLASLIESVIPGALEIIQDETGLYINQKKAIYDLIEAKRAEAMLSANQESYNEALISRDGYLEDLTNAKMSYEEKQKQMQALLDQLAPIQEEIDWRTAEGTEKPDNNNAILLNLHGKRDDLEGLIKKLLPEFDTAKTLYEETLALYGETEAVITNYEQLMAANATGDAESIMEALQNYKLFTEGFKTVANASADELKTQAEQYISFYQTAQEMLEKGIITKERFAEIASMANQAIKEAESAGVALDQGVTEGIKENQVDVEKAFSEAMISVVNAGKAAIDSHSPSQVTKEQIGLPMAQGIVEGITEGGPLISQALSAILQNAMGPTEGAEGEESMVMENPFQSFFLNMASWLQNQGTAILINWQALLLLFRDSGIYQTSQMVGGMQEQLDRLPEMADSAGSRMMDSLSQVVEGRREQLIAQVRQMMNEVNAAMGGSGGGYGGPGVSPAAGRASSGGNPPVINNNFYTPTASSLSVYNATKDAMARTLYFE